MLDTRTVGEAKKLVKLLRIEAAGIVSTEEKTKLTAWLRQQAEELDRLQLLGSRGKTDRINQTEARSLETLRQAKRTMQETEEVAHGITEGLASNREVVAKNLKRNKDVQADLSASEKLLNNLSRWWR